MYPETTAATSADTGVIIAYLITLFVLYLWSSFVFYRLSVKAGLDNPWMNFVPVLNIVKMCHLVNWSGWMALLYFVPFVGSFIGIYHYYLILKAFGRSGWMLVLFYVIPFFIIFYMLYMAFSDNVEYEL